MRSLTFLLFFMLLTPGSNMSGNPDIIVTQLKCNNLENPAGTDRNPTFSWQLQSRVNNVRQTAYQIIIGSDKKVSEKNIGDIWNSGKVLSGQSAWIKYLRGLLEPGEDYYWRVRIWDSNDTPSPWSSTGKFITGLFDRNDWSGARWIGFEDIPDSLLLVPGVHGKGDNIGEKAKKRTVIPYFRKEFSLKKKISRAYVFISGLGQYELYINGDKIGDHFLAPGWTDYRKTCFFNTFDVTEKLSYGLNCIGTIVGNGFYNINRERYRKLVIAYGAPKMILKLEVQFSDGTTDVVISDGSWKASPSAITYSSIYGGEDYDSRLEQTGWNKPGFNDSKWEAALLVKEPAGDLRPEKDYPVKAEEIITGKKIIRLRNNCYVYDFGQNASGIIKIKAKGKEGQVVRFTPGELLGEDSLVTQKASGEPFYFSYTLKSEDAEIWMPRFTYYGFRYVQADGAVPANNPNPENLPVVQNIEFLHTRNSSPEVGRFKCSNELFNSIYNLINWSVKSNLASVATDCPHREKLGWLEQTHLMGNSIKFIYDIHNLYDKIIDDMTEAQLENGLVPDIAPEYVPFTDGFRDSPEWGSACVILPWDMYNWYGDIEAVRKAYPMMKKYVDYLRKKSAGNILSHGLGDWYDLGPKFPGEAQLTPKSVTATSIYFYDARLLSEMANLIGEKEDAGYYSNLSEDIRKAFDAKFFNPVTKVISTGSQTAYAMPLFFGMVDDSRKKEVVENLIRSIEENKKALTAGDIGYRYLLRVLEEEGYSQLIYEMNSRKDVPGYGYQLAKGATSLTESWAGLRDVSNNHMMLGHLMEWFFSGIGGIRQEEGSTSYENLLLEPEPVGDLTWAETSFCSVHGEVFTSWIIKDNYFTLKVRIPANCRASVIIPQKNPEKITIGGDPVKTSPVVSNVSVKNGKTICKVSSGEFVFKTSMIN